MQKEMGLKAMSLFDKVYTRQQTDSLKWDKLKLVYGRDNVDGIIPMWVADMDFAAPKSITQAIQKRLDNPVYGYSFEGEACTTATTNWLKSQHDTIIDSSWVLYHQGVVPAIASVVEAFTSEADTVLMTAPIYPPFFNSPKQLAREVAFCPLDESNGVYTLNFDKLEAALAPEQVTLFILCHPHNPIGFAWDETALRQIDALCAKHGVLLLSDEIHSDLVLTGTHTPLLKITAHPENVITLFAPTKTFNIAGIHAAMMFVPDAQKRQTLQKTMQSHAQGGLNIFAIAAIEGAFSKEGANWLAELKDYLRANIRYTAEQLNAIDGLRIHENEATYLMWLDYRATNLDEKDVMNRLLDAGVALDPGTKYGEYGKGFLRINIACPKETLEQGISRIKAVFTA